MQHFCGLYHCDSLNEWLMQQIFPQLGLYDGDGDIEVRQLIGSNRVYRFSTAKNGLEFSVVGKFHGKVLDSPVHKKFLLMQEFQNIQRLQALGFHDGQYQVVRCLGYSEANDYLLVTKYVDGYQLDHFIKEAIFKNDVQGLYDALADLAYFLYLLHSRSIRHDIKVVFNEEYAYAHKTLNRLTGQTSWEDIEDLSKMVDRWKYKPEMLSVSSVQVHGDCTPTNFIFSDDSRLVALDLERSRRSDPAFDTGRVAGELMHHFIMFTGKTKKAEPLIHHFYKEYCSHSHAPAELFDEITKRNPFYQAITELRIAKNYWISPEHRLRLIDEAKKCLRY